MMFVPQDQPSRLIRSTPRRLRMKSTAVPTSFTAVSVRTIGGFWFAGWSISAGRVHRKDETAQRGTAPADHLVHRLLLLSHGERRLVGAPERHAGEHRLHRFDVALARAFVVARVDELDRTLHDLDHRAVGGRAEL